MLSEFFILCLIPYLVGSIPCGVLLARTQSVDIRNQGSGNIGATNMARVLGKKAGLLTLLGDVLKGFLVVWGASQLYQNPALMALAGLMVFLGHIFSIFLNFKGGKGVATGFGIHIYVMPGATLFALGIFAFTLWASKYVSLSSIVAAISLPVFGMFLKVPLPYLLVSLLIATLIVFKHQSNIRRIINKTESRFPRK